MNDLQKAQKQLEDKGITTLITNGCLYVCIDDVQLELAEYEVEYQARSYDDNQEEEE